MMSFLGIFLPPVIDLINRKVASSDTRFIVSVIVCALFGTLTNFIDSNGWNEYAGWSYAQVAEAVITSWMTVVGTTQLAYKAAYEGSKLQEKIRTDDSKLQ